jgi:hypothetical protein
LGLRFFTQIREEDMVVLLVVYCTLADIIEMVLWVRPPFIPGALYRCKQYSLGTPCNVYFTFCNISIVFVQVFYRYNHVTTISPAGLANGENN